MASLPSTPPIYYLYGVIARRYNQAGVASETSHFEDSMKHYRAPLSTSPVSKSEGVIWHWGRVNNPCVGGTCQTVLQKKLKYYTFNLNLLALT